MSRPTYNRFSQYRIMWVLVFFDLPTNTKTEMKTAAKFRKTLIEDGFSMHQFSIYIRNCPSRENAYVHERRVKKSIPKNGKVTILTITDRQFGLMQTFYGRIPQTPLEPVLQLAFF